MAKVKERFFTEEELNDSYIKGFSDATSIMETAVNDSIRQIFKTGTEQKELVVAIDRIISATYIAKFQLDRMNNVSEQEGI